MPSIFDVIREHVRRGELEQAVAQTGGLVRGGASDLAAGLPDEAAELVARFRGFSHRPLNEVLDERDRLRTDLLAYLARLETGWRGLPLPVLAPHAEPFEPPTGERAVDRREAELTENPMRRIAWLEKGLVAARAVCKVHGTDKIGTAFLLKNGCIVTNNHVLSTPDEAAGATLLFNYQEDAKGLPLADIRYGLRRDRFATSVELDCSIVGVDAMPAELAQWGWLPIATAPDIATGSSVSIIQHPLGNFKRIALTGSVVTNSGSLRYIKYETSTMKGSSGAPVLNDNWEVVALHRAAGDWWEPRKRYVNNEGVRFTAIRQDAALAPYLA